MSKALEFWIQASNMKAHDSKPPIVKSCFHVIEYSAFEKAQKDWEQAATQNYADKCEIEKLKKQNEVMLNDLLLENKLLKNQLCFTNSSWPHEKQLHEQVEKLQSDIEKLRAELVMARDILKDAFYIFEVSVANKCLKETELDKRHDALERFCMYDNERIDKLLKEVGLK